ncbi:hypothetical protein NDU88_005705 [Pleurodeles waltl]|uniref:Uncharacterized protein n=1 Tax=Pleurodeles waltl TaxID=8319 RepID=A0AAV7LLY7_PLEWA|nr:hypothetical protein NDU88_005705 [Pleurodeles waltl]
MAEDPKILEAVALLRQAGRLDLLNEGALAPGRLACRASVGVAREGFRLGYQVTAVVHNVLAALVVPDMVESAAAVTFPVVITAVAAVITFVVAVVDPVVVASVLPAVVVNLVLACVAAIVPDLLEISDDVITPVVTA